jgi:hypothetical protein
MESDPRTLFPFPRRNKTTTIQGTPPHNPTLTQPRFLNPYQFEKHILIEQVAQLTVKSKNLFDIIGSKHAHIAYEAIQGLMKKYAHKNMDRPFYEQTQAI